MKFKKSSNLILLIFSIISFTCLIYILYQINTNLVEALNIDKSNCKTTTYLMGFGHLFILLFHFYAIIFIFIHFRRFTEYKLLKTALLIIGVISLFAMAGEKVMIDDIAKEYRLGLWENELCILNIEYMINMTFTIILFLFILRTFRLVYTNDSKGKFVEETIFTIAQCMGIVTGITGLFFIVFANRQIPVDKLWVLIPFYALFLIPYALAVVYWLSLKRKQHINDWYDEKQLQDILKSSLVTLLLSIPGLAIFLLIKIPLHFYILPYYIFLVLLVFSSSTLYFFKIKDVG